MTEKNRYLSRFGFRFERGGAHTSRTMMLEELRALLTHVNRPDADKSDYFRAINEENRLGKRSGKTRILTYRHLVDRLAPMVEGRLLVFFPGSYENNNYRLLDGYDGWNYLAVPITADKEY